jgi:hypothetical protein
MRQAGGAKAYLLGRSTLAEMPSKWFWLRSKGGGHIALAVLMARAQPAVF